MQSKIQGISHITLICQNLEKSTHMFCDLFGATILYSSEEKQFSIFKEKFLLIGDLWIALMERPPLERSYNHLFELHTGDLATRLDYYNSC